MDSKTYGQSPSPACCVFEAQISVTDGGEPIDLIGETEGEDALIMRGDDVVGIGGHLESAWNDYLYTCGADMHAPVNDEELAEMWRKYDSHNDQGDGRRENAPPSQPTSSPFHPPSC